MSRKKDLYKERKANGLCVVCGKSKENLGGTICNACKAKRKEQRMRAKEQAKHTLKEILEKVIPKEKTCEQCGETKSSIHFYVRAQAKDGLQSKCKSCVSGNKIDDGTELVLGLERTEQKYYNLAFKGETNSDIARISGISEKAFSLRDVLYPSLIEARARGRKARRRVLGGKA